MIFCGHCARQSRDGLFALLHRRHAARKLDPDSWSASASGHCKSATTSEMCLFCTFSRKNGQACVPGNPTAQSGRMSDLPRVSLSTFTRASIRFWAKLAQPFCREKYWRVQPFRNGQQADYRDPASRYTPPQICLKNLNHVALEAVDPLGLTDFYTRVLGFKSIKRPNLPFEGSWLEGAGLLVHIIAEDPSVPKKIHNWKVIFPCNSANSSFW